MASTCLRARHSLPSVFQPLKAPRIAPRRARNPVHVPHRKASTSRTTDSLLLSRLRAFVLTTALGASLYTTYLYTTDTRASFHRYLIPRLLRLVFPDAEAAQHASTSSLATLYRLNLHPRERSADSSELGVTIFGTTLQNPIGISAGLDKDARVPDPLFALGASVVEVGGCTPRPQEGNAKPRVWRVPSVEGIVNRYGLNSRGADAMATRLRQRVRQYARQLGLTEEEVLDNTVGLPPGSLTPGKLLLVQVAKNKDTDDKDVGAVAADYVYCVRRLGRYADVLVVNVSSPNTPGLRDLQAVEPLTRILSAVVDEARQTRRRVKPKVMVKVSPDEDEDGQMEGICQAVWASGVDGVIVGNTTKRRTGLVPEGVKMGRRETRALMETGGFSGLAMFERTLDLVGRYRKMLDSHSLRSKPEESVDAVPTVDGAVSLKGPSTSTDEEQKVIFATGGIINGEQTLKILNAGASVAMVYTGMVYGGAGTVTRIKGEMRESVNKSSK